jgi:HSP20 family protein
MINRTLRPGDAVVRREPRAAVLTPFRDLLGFDPFRDALSSWNVEYGVTRTENGYEVEVPVPGYKPEDIDVTYQDGIITIAGTSERRNFTRTLTVPEDVDDEAIQAHVEHGLLRLQLSRRPEAQPKKIKISAG